MTTVSPALTRPMAIIAAVRAGVVLLAAFVALNLIQSSFTGFCPAEKVFTALGIGGKEDPVRLVFTADPGEAVVVALSLAACGGGSSDETATTAAPTTGATSTASVLPTVDELELPPILKEIVLSKRGLCILVGATGSGKSTSLAAMLDYRNEILFHQTLTRYADAWHHHEPFYYYFVRIIPLFWLPLIALLVHPLVGAGEQRAAWLENARALDLELRGPRPKPGLAPVEAAIAKLAKRGRGEAIAAWWQELAEVLAPVLALPDDAALADALNVLAAAGEALCGPRLWGEADGRQVADARTGVCGMGGGFIAGSMLLSRD